MYISTWGVVTEAISGEEAISGGAIIWGAEAISGAAITWGSEAIYSYIVSPAILSNPPIPPISELSACIEDGSSGTGGSGAGGSGAGGSGTGGSGTGGSGAGGSGTGGGVNVTVDSGGV